MTPEEQLVQQIQQAVDSDRLDPGPVLEELAERYADLCYEVNERLQRCSEYLEKGMRSEAVHEAERSPSILELVDLVRFDGVKRWRNICADLDLAGFVSFDDEVLERLRGECSKEAALAPLLQEYRRHVHGGSREECIPLLRKIRKRDQGNPVWAENLRPLEEAQLPKLIDRAEQALEDDDLPELRGLCREFTHEERVVPPPESLVERIRAKLIEERTRASREKAQRLGASLRRAASAEDLKAVGALLMEWKQLEESAGFQFPEDLRRIAGRARKWYETSIAEEQAEAEFRRLIGSLRRDLSSGANDAGHLRGKMGELENLGRPIPEELRREVGLALSRIKQRARARRHRRVLLAGCALVLLLAGAVAGAIVFRRNRVRTNLLTRLSSLFEQEAYGRAEDLLEGISERDPEFYESPEVRDFRDRTEAARQRETDRIARFEEIARQLRTVRRDGFQIAEEKIQALLDEGTESAGTPEDHEFLESWLGSWEDSKDRRIRLTDGKIQAVIAEMQLILEEKNRGSFPSPADERAALQRMEARIASVSRMLDGASSETTERFNALEAELDSWRLELASRIRAAEEADRRFLELKKLARTAIPDFAEYEKILRELTSDFSAEPETADYGLVLSELPQVRAAAALEQFTLGALPASSAEIKMITEWIEGAEAPLAGTVWEADLRAVADYTEAMEEVRAKLPNLVVSRSRMLNLRTVQYRPKDSDTWRTYYCPKMLSSRPETDEHGVDYTIYWGEIYYYERHDQTPWLEHTSNIFPDYLNSREYEIKKQPDGMEGMPLHSRFLYEFVAEGSQAKELDVHLLRGIDTLLKDTEMETVPRAWLVKRMCHFLAEYFPRQVPESEEMVDLADSMDTEVPWMNSNHPRTLEAEDAITETLGRFPDLDGIMLRLRKRREVLGLALSRGVKCAGTVRVDGDGPPRLNLVISPPGEVWVLTPGHAGTPPGFEIVARTEGAQGMRLCPNAEHVLRRGQVLLAPGDGLDTVELQEKALPQGLKVKALVRRPASWPVNGW